MNDNLSHLTIDESARQPDAYRVEIGGENHFFPTVDELLEFAHAQGLSEVTYWPTWYGTAMQGDWVGWPK